MKKAARRLYDEEYAPEPAEQEKNKEQPPL
jgi:hypothetical protein